MNGTDGGLAHAPLMFVFLDISSLPRHRRLLEDVLRLRVIENQFHPRTTTTGWSSTTPAAPSSGSTSSPSASSARPWPTGRR
ncbi:hypothetical protein ACFQHO_10840 [Actinomadura yumaensis]|uniref:hypothetical protein n=1 Tax=Actinomadura yumaensis TaxID=111807 RepID=UPI0036063362